MTEPMTEPMTLWRPTGAKELGPVRASDWKAWPPRLPDQPIFYPVLEFNRHVLGLIEITHEFGPNITARP